MIPFLTQGYRLFFFHHRIESHRFVRYNETPTMFISMWLYDVSQWFQIWTRSPMQEKKKFSP